MSNVVDKRQCIIESALELIQEHGFHASPISQVAKNAGVAAGTIYTYFENKEEMIKEVYVYVAEKIEKYISERDYPELTFKERFFNYWKNFMEFYELNPAIHGFYDQFLNSPFNSEEIQNKPNVWHEWSIEFFQSGIEQGAIKDINPMVISILVGTNVNSIIRIKSNFKNKLAKNNIDLDHTFILIWDGIKKD